MLIRQLVSYDVHRKPVIEAPVEDKASATARKSGGVHRQGHTQMSDR